MGAESKGLSRFSRGLCAWSHEPPLSPLQCVRDASGTVVEIIAELAPLPPDGKRPKGNVHWVPENAVPVEVRRVGPPWPHSLAPLASGERHPFFVHFGFRLVSLIGFHHFLLLSLPRPLSPNQARLYGHLFKVPFVSSNWEAELNHESEVVVTGALADPSILVEGVAPRPETHFQFERVGVFVVDKDSAALGRIVVNRTTPLKVAKAVQASKSDKDVEKEAKRKADQAAALELKKAMANVSPQEMFKIGDEAKKYSAWDEDGVPTHDAEGKEVSKNLRKSLKKDWEKQKKVFEKAK